MGDKKQFIEFEILKTKSNIFDYKKLIEEEEKRLYNLYGALETLQSIENEVTK